MNTICTKFSLIKETILRLLNFTKSLGVEGYAWSRKSSAESGKAVDQGLLCRKSSAKKKKERARTSIRYYFQLFFKLEQRKKTHTHKLDMVLLKFVAGRKALVYIEVKF